MVSSERRSFLYKYSVNSRHVLIGWYPFSFPYLLHWNQGFPQNINFVAFIIKNITSNKNCLIHKIKSIRRIKDYSIGNIWNSRYVRTTNLIWGYIISIWNCRSGEQFCISDHDGCTSSYYIFIFGQNKWIFTTCNITTTNVYSITNNTSCH